MRRSYRQIQTIFVHLLIGIMLTILCTSPFATPSSLTVVLAPAPAYAQSGTIYYVRPTGNDSNSGLAWNTAFATLQQALATATTGAQIWVAAGTYYPDEGPSQTNDDRASTFSLKDGVAVYGGFAGTETSPASAT